MRWLLIKDLQILRRSPLLVGLLVLYPIVIATLMGLALSRGPDKPQAAVVNLVPAAAERISVGGEEVDLRRYAGALYQAVDPIEVPTREEALRKVHDGEVLAAVVIPPDLPQKLQAGTEPAMIEVLYNAEDPAKREYVESTIQSQVAELNATLTDRFSQVAAGYVDLLVSGGKLTFLGQSIDVLGLERTEEILTRAREELPEGSSARAEVDQVIEFARLGRENLGVSDDVLTSVGRPIQVDARVIDGATTPLTSYAAAIAVAVSLMFVTLLLASGGLALEREENTFRRLVRGLVSRTALLVEKVGLAAGCAVLVSVALLAGLALFLDLGWERFPLWIAALAVGAVAFGAMGVAIGALAREVRAASLLAFMLSLPVAFLALIPSGAVSGPVLEATRVVSAAFPFRPAVAALDAALNDAGQMLLPLAHLAVLALAFGALARVGLRRFG
jgi:ABC-type transport system involved in cytochrome c biogenesis permease component